MSTIDYCVRDSVAEILLNSAPVNAISEPMLDELLSAINKAATDDSVHAVIIGSAVPRRFCAGLDLKAIHDTSFEHSFSLVNKLYSGLFDAQASLGKPSIAAVSGTARGGGMTLAVSCDMLIASDTASFGYPEIDVGVTPAIHYTHLPRIIGKHRAFELLFTGRTFNAAEAHALGLVNAIVPEEEVMNRARAIAQSFCQKSPQVMRMGRNAFHKAIDIEYRRGVASAVENFGNVVVTADAKEGMTAFVEKRQPKWPSAQGLSVKKA
ncbi:enoyl-CoA hydratase/isomerase family protein [Alcaligenaceae bacterium]|nr:enoyl-CoA hydratase/isomerase family protein [Alcaligenaceae bacterium]